MKKIFLLIVLTSISVCSFSQVIDEPVQPLTKMDYLKKSKNQRITSWVLLGTGAVIDIIGFATFPKNYDALFPTDPEKRKANTSFWLIGIGSATMLASIPFTISAHSNKKKAASMSINTQQIPQLNKNSLHSIDYPALTMKIRL